MLCAENITNKITKYVSLTEQPTQFFSHIEYTHITNKQIKIR